MGMFTVHFRPFSNSFIQVKVKKVGMPHRMNFTSLKNYPSHSKMPL